MPPGPGVVSALPEFIGEKGGRLAPHAITRRQDDAAMSLGTNAGFPTLKLILVGISCSFDPNWTRKFATCVGDAGCLGVFYVPPGMRESVRAFELIGALCIEGLLLRCLIPFDLAACAAA